MKIQLNLRDIILIFVVLIGFQSCIKLREDSAINFYDYSKDNRASSSIEVEYQYFIDLEPVAPYSPDTENDTSSIFLIESKPSTTVGFDVLVKIHSFSDEEAYLLYADSLGFLQIRIYHEMFYEWSHIADSFNMDSIVASIDSVPAWRDEIQTNIYYQYFPEDFGSARLRGLATILNGCWQDCQLPGGCSSECNNKWAISTFPSGISSLWIWGLKDKVSSFSNYGIGGYNTCFRRSFFRNRLWQHWDFYGFHCIDLCGNPLGQFNNKGNSWWNAGL
jgi:hypothetical protein